MEKAYHALVLEASPPAPLAAPVDAPERIAPLDMMRGFALLGILVMNIQSFSMISAAYDNPTSYGDLNGANWWVWLLCHLFADQKMYGIFSMLFGAGILLMTSRAEARGSSLGLHYRRMMWLVLFGLLHAHLLWPGDILYTYGMCGLLVYLFRRRSVRTLTLLAFGFLAAGSIVFAAVGWSLRTSWSSEEVIAFKHDTWLPTAEMIRDELADNRGGWLGQMGRRSAEARDVETIAFVLFLFWKSTGNMLLGMALFKAGAFSGKWQRAVYARVAAAGFLIGLPIIGIGVWRNFAAGWNVRYSFFLGSQYNYWGAIGVDFGWIGLLMLAATSPRFEGAKRALGAVGRMAFTNYILQTLLCTTLFYGHGFGLFGKVSRVGQISICVAVWLVEIPLSRAWMRRFRFGPLEWLWRSLTYWRRMPMALPAPT
jgi:uncharacterized protein